MGGKEISELIIKAYSEINPNKAINLFNELCDEVNIPHLAEYERGYVVGPEGNSVDYIIEQIVKGAERKLKNSNELNEFYDSLEGEFICYIEDDNVKLNKYEEQGIYVGEDIALSIKSEDIKKKIILNAIKHFNFGVPYLSILSTIHDDSFKSKIIDNGFYNLTVTKGLIKTLESDEQKVKYIEKFLLQFEPEIIASLSSDETKLKYMLSLNKKGKREVLKSLKSDDLKLENMLEIDIEVVKTLNSDTKKRAWLNENKEKLTEKDIYELITTLADDNEKLHGLELLEDRKYKLNILQRATRADFSILQEECKKLGIDIFRPIIDSNKGILPRNYTKKWESIGLPQNMTFGIEIEADCDYSFLFTQFPTIAKRWDAKNEFTDNNENSEMLEVSSPILTDCASDIEEIYGVNTILKNGGLQVPVNCGGHIHIGADYLTSKESYQRLVELWCNCEKIFYEISNAPNEKERSAYFIYAKPISASLKDKGLDIDNDLTKEDFMNILQNYQGDRDRSINFTRIENESPTIEFRVPNGTLNPDTWIENIRLFGRLVQVSEMLGNLDRKSSHEYSSDERRKLWLATMISNKDVPKDDKAKFLINLLFDEEEYKQVYFDRYNANKGLFKEEDKRFKMIDFQNLYREMERIPENNQVKKGGNEHGTKDESGFDRG